MTKHLLAGVAAAVLISGTALPARTATTSWDRGGSRASAGSFTRHRHDNHDRLSTSRRRSGPPKEAGVAPAAGSARRLIPCQACRSKDADYLWGSL
jgi:hypothetical protein